MEYSGKKVVVGLTGRIGSGVTAFLLKKQGFQVIGVSIINHSMDAFKNSSNPPKCFISKLEEIEKFCKFLGIPFYATDGKSEFEDKVLDPFTANRLTAKANTTCFNCTSLRIQVLYEKMKKLKADFISTGHFCKVHKNLNSDNFSIHANNDVDSDQSFLLAGIPEIYLKHLILPLGELRVNEVDTIAKKFNLPLKASLSDGKFCYREPSEYASILEKRVPKSLIKEGQVHNIDNDIIQGEHKGILHHYITEKNLKFNGINQADQNIQIVNYHFDRYTIEIGSDKHLTFRGCQLVDLHLSTGLDRSKPMNCFIKNKYSHQYVGCMIFFKNNSSAYLEFESPIYPIIEGEKVVLFDKNTRNAKVIGLGRIGQRGEFKLIDRAEEFKTKNEANEEVKRASTFKF